MQAKDIMTGTVVSIPPEGSVADAVRLMLDNHVSALPVIDAKGELVGLISEGDLMRRVRDGGAVRRSWWLELFSGEVWNSQEYVAQNSRHVTDVMTREVVTVNEDAPVGEIARLLEKHRIKRVPVLRQGRVVGIVSRANLLHAISAVPSDGLPQPTDDDRALRERLNAALREVPGAAASLANFTVESGKVTIWGVADSDAQESAVRVAAENVPGVKEVEINMGRVPAWAYGI